MGAETNWLTDGSSGGAAEGLKPRAASDAAGCAIIAAASRMGVLAGTAGSPRGVAALGQRARPVPAQTRGRADRRGHCGAGQRRRLNRRSGWNGGLRACRHLRRRLGGGSFRRRRCRQRGVQAAGRNCVGGRGRGVRGGRRRIGRSPRAAGPHWAPRRWRPAAARPLRCRRAARRRCSAPARRRWRAIAPSAAGHRASPWEPGAPAGWPDLAWSRPAGRRPCGAA